MPGLFTEVPRNIFPSLSHRFPLPELAMTSDNVTGYDPCVCLRFFSPVNICCFVWNWQLTKKKTGRQKLIKLDIFHNIKKEKK
jgi:hypothetical protein